ncbi:MULTISPECIES: 3-oxoacyl-[acyl-carrier-protein] reductase [Caproicibacterium]|jgi:3-oxoacyl-[acyl-carrier protein] reductase|uniref:3-oxoacyl-[acyl-carrier-protein] reductase n=1 Tax=Caproicibacterium lactatifermentans TaxID=2666138 RepID=A0A859DPA7_9FIRM|nr:3-oxoacyl-[acyl-carrier-protein] reductase [Caproicibacterium lactatifermentans]ARP50391.1 3-oxoacyl-[acyl-carrier-protein] reductase [Ruminococcaceae bacterium CPB6]MDD4807988.1 3-oxoacyl-[acyl-carrier-protein] reductase [Oscillospiraceae bacterium]QKN23887.1 3-oxoacyl-[acyl-carrier-protein] reductase [Caproicibacterium lactatifermentans]QKO31043.1 3-oxoacyl-[acyl-carrier-protein] reductase [Caproicibacterium lactatifermentans]
MGHTKKTALVTGGSRGIGHATALQLAKDGMNLAILYAGNTSAAQETVKELQALGAVAKAYQCDVSSSNMVKATVKQVLQDFGGVDVLVNNAGITRDNLLLAQKEEDLDRVLSVSLKGAFYMIQALYRNFMKKRAGHIINISSIVGLHGNAGQASYAAAKAGVVGLTKSVAKELAGRGITCNAVAPGFIQSDMTAALSEQARSQAIAAVPLGRPGLPEDVAQAVAFLASDRAAYITGVVLRVDGGMGM